MLFRSRLLKKAAQIDTTNTTTLRYLNEVEEATGIGTNLNDKKLLKRRIRPVEEERKILGPTSYMSGNDTIIQPTPFRESSTMATFLNIALGFLLGAALIWFLAIPANTRKINQSANQQVTDANTKLAAESAKVGKLEKEIEGYQTKVDEANQTMDDAKEKVKSYDVLLSAAVKYLGGDQTGAGTELADVDQESLEENGKALYDAIKGAAKSSVYSAQYSEGTTAYTQGDFDKAIELLTKATKTDETQYDAWYYLAFAYSNKGDTENADKILAEMIRRFPEYQATLEPYITDKTVMNQTAETDADGNSEQQETNADGTPVQPETNADGTPVTDTITTDTDAGYADTYAGDGVQAW